MIPPPHEQLRALRRARGLTQPVLAERAGTSATSVSHVERQHTSPTAWLLEKLAEGLDADWVLVPRERTGELPELTPPPIGSIAASEACGTPAGYSRHIRAGQETCEPCRAVMRPVWAQVDARRAEKRAAAEAPAGSAGAA